MEYGIDGSYKCLSSKLPGPRHMVSIVLDAIADAKKKLFNAATHMYAGSKKE
jgi:hypothetical protein